MSLILGIETSCDETSVAVVEDGRRIRSNIVASQIDLHRQYGGVFPEVAARQHILTLLPVIHEGLEQAQVAWEQIDAVAVTCGPGLAGSLLVGVNAAKGIAWARGLPLIGVNHLEGHVYSNWIEVNGNRADKEFPALVLIVSGGHTELVAMTGHGQYQRLGATIDDAAGEAFDKVARLLGLGYPGGPAIQHAATNGRHDAFDFPRAWLAGSHDFSFSGLKTAVLRAVQRLSRSDAGANDALTPQNIADLAASFQQAVVDALVTKTLRAAEAIDATQICVCGGVAANAALRQTMRDRSTWPVSIPPFSLCTDNAAMIAAAGFYRWQRGDLGGLALDVTANLALA